MDTVRSTVALVRPESGGSSCRGIFPANSSSAYLVMCPFRHEGTCCWGWRGMEEWRGDGNKWISRSTSQSLCLVQARVLRRCFVRLHEISEQEDSFSFHLGLLLLVWFKVRNGQCWLRRASVPLSPHTFTPSLYSHRYSCCTLHTFCHFSGYHTRGKAQAPRNRRPP